MAPPQGKPIWLAFYHCLENHKTIPAGTLFVRISTEAGTVTKKIVKK